MSKVFRSFKKAFNKGIQFSAVRSQTSFIRFILVYLTSFNIIINSVFVKIYFLSATSIETKLIILHFCVPVVTLIHSLVNSVSEQILLNFLHKQEMFRRCSLSSSPISAWIQGFTTAFEFELVPLSSLPAKHHKACLEMGQEQGQKREGMNLGRAKTNEYFSNYCACRQKVLGG